MARGDGGPPLDALKGRTDLGREAGVEHLAVVVGEEMAGRLGAADSTLASWHAAHAAKMAAVAAAANGALRATSVGGSLPLRPRFLSQMPTERRTAEMATEAAAACTLRARRRVRWKAVN